MVCWCTLLTWAIYACGLLFLCKGGFRLYQIIRVHFFLKEIDVIGRYGKNSWVLITASSDGIGGALAVSFAKRGFNVVINGRTDEKIKLKQEEIRKIAPSVQTRGLVRDFSLCAQPGFFEGIYDELKELDISVLVNNVGIASANLPGLQKAEDLQNTVIVNTLAQTMMWHYFSPKMQTRPHKSAIIDLSSLKSLGPSYFAPLYIATKVFNKYLTFSLSFTPRYQNIDFLCLTPGFISTVLTAKLPDTRLTSTAEECGESVLRVLGQTDHSYTTGKSALHGIVNEFLFFLLPARLAARYAFAFYMWIQTAKPPTPGAKAN